MTIFIVENDLIEKSPLEICKQYLEINEPKDKRSKKNKNIIAEQHKKINEVLIYVNESLKRIRDIIAEIQLTENQI